MLAARLLVLAAAVPVLAGCGARDPGPPVDQTRDVSAFTRIETAGSIELRVRVGEPQDVQVRAGRNVIGDVRTEVRDGTLHVEDDDAGDDDVVVEATVPALTGIQVTGSGRVHAEGLRAGVLEVRSAGSAEIELSGTVGRLDVGLEGSGGGRLGDLAARTARVSVHGSGGVEVRVAERLDVEIQGSGAVRYHGHPTVNEIVDGSGDLHRID